MKTKIKWTIFGVAIFAGALLLYEFQGNKKLTPASSVALPFCIEERDVDGRLLYSITALGPSKPTFDAAGMPLPGHITLDNPVVLVSDKTGKYTRVEADSCDLISNRAVGIATGPLFSYTLHNPH